MGIGLLYAARGLGTGIGPIAARAGVAERHWPTMFGLGLAVTGLCYLTVGRVGWGVWLPLLVVLAHAPSGANWVASTVLLQKRTPDRYRGRVFATEWLLITLVDAVAILAVAALLETGWATLRQAISLVRGGRDRRRPALAPDRRAGRDEEQGRRLAATPCRLTVFKPRPASGPRTTPRSPTAGASPACEAALLDGDPELLGVEAIGPRMVEQPAGAADERLEHLLGVEACHPA